MNLLFLCKENKNRSKTGQELCAAMPGFTTKSAGFVPSSDTVVSLEILQWADMVFTMDKWMNYTINGTFPQIQTSKLFCLEIPDDYVFMEDRLVNLLIKSLIPHLSSLVSFDIESYFEDKKMNNSFKQSSNIRDLFPSDQELMEKESTITNYPIIYLSIIIIVFILAYIL